MKAKQAKRGKVRRGREADTTTSMDVLRCMFLLCDGLLTFDFRSSHVFARSLAICRSDFGSYPAASLSCLCRPFGLLVGWNARKSIRLPVYLCYLPLGICFDNDMKVLCFLTVQDSKRRQAFIRVSLYRLNVYTFCRLHLAELSCLIAGGNLPDPLSTRLDGILTLSQDDLL